MVKGSERAVKGQWLIFTADLQPPPLCRQVTQSQRHAAKEMACR